MEKLRDLIKEAVKDLYGVDDARVDFAGVPSEVEGDYATNIAMR